MFSSEVSSRSGGAQSFLSRHCEALQQRPVAIFTLGPTQAGEKEWEAPRAQLDLEVAKYSWLKPIAVELFGGRYDPALLRFPDNILTWLPTPLHDLPASDVRDWTAIRAWAGSLVTRLQPALA